jgi:hypothetical protein
VARDKLTVARFCDHDAAQPVDGENLSSEKADIFFYYVRFSDGGYKELYLLGYKAVQSVKSRPTSRRNVSLPSSM